MTISLEHTRDGAIVTIMGDTPEIEDIEVSWGVASEFLFIRQQSEGEDTADVIALTPQQAYSLARVLDFSTVEQ